MREISITVDADRRASAPIGAGIICNNSDQVIVFDIDAAAGFDTTAPINAVLVTARGALPPIPFAEGRIVAPVLSGSDGTLVYVGLSQGEIKTSSPAKLDIFRSIYSVAGGREAEPDPGDENIPIVTEVTLDDLLQISDVEEGRRVLITLRTLQSIIGGGSASNGHSPYIGKNGNWYAYDDDHGEYFDTGVDATGPQGPQGEAGPRGRPGETGPAGTYTAGTGIDITGDVISVPGLADKQNKDFPVVYGVTTYAQIAAAITAARTPKLTYTGIEYTFSAQTATSMVFVAVGDDLAALYKATVSSDNVWSEDYFNLDDLVTATQLAEKQDKLKYTTLTLATSDWTASGNEYTCTKSVAGMTATSIVWIEYSDAETDFTEAQGAGTLTFTVSDLPSAAVTVNVAFANGEALT